MSKLRLCTLIGGFCLAFSSLTPTYAADLNSNPVGNLSTAFGALVNNTSASSFHTQSRGYLMGGGGLIKFANDQISLVDITPPSFSVGCNGMSYFFGGLSYISGQQFVAMLKNFATAALGYAFNIALRTLCPVCSTVLADLQKAAQLASQFASNSCQMAAKVMNAAINSSSALQNTVSKKAAWVKSLQGGENDFLKNIEDSSFMQKPAEWLQDIHDYLNKDGTDDTKETKAQNYPVGNVTWKAMAGMSYYNRVLIQSLTGVRFDVIKPEPQVQKIAATLNASQFTDIFMLGVLGSLGDSGSSATHIEIIDCKEAKSSMPFDIASFASGGCTPRKIGIKDSQWYSKSKVNSTTGGIDMVDYGFFGAVYASLMQAVYNVEINKDLGTAQDVTLPAQFYGNATVHASFTSEQIKSIIGLSPLPIYQAINLAAINPSIAEGMVSMVSTYVAQELAFQYIKQDVLNLAAVGSNGVVVNGLTGTQLSQIQKKLESLQVILNQNLGIALTKLQEEQAWVSQIHQVQNVLYQQVLKKGMAGNFAYSSALSASRGGS